MRTKRQSHEQVGTTRILFTGARVFDGTGAAPAAADVIVEAGRILDVGLGLEGDRVVDLSGMSLLPGLLDCHVHVTVSEIDLLRLLQRPFSYQFYEAAGNLATTLRLGITHVRDAAGADLGIKHAVDTGLLVGPRMQIAITMLSQTGGHGDAWLPCGLNAMNFFVAHPGRPEGIVDGPDEVRRKVRELIRDGADVIKVATSGGVLSPLSDLRTPHFRDEELAVLAGEARSAGRGVMAHAVSTEGIKAAIRAGVRSIEHGVHLDDEAVSLMLERGTWLVPTLIGPPGVLAAAEAGASVPEASVSKAREAVEAHRDSFRRAVEAGVRIAMGTDCPVSPHGSNLKELQAMVEHGRMSPAAALVAATSSAAALLGVERDFGTIEPGKRADLVVVDGDPFDFAALPGAIAQVWKDGERVIA